METALELQTTSYGNAPGLGYAPADDPNLNPSLLGRQCVKSIRTFLQVETGINFDMEPENSPDTDLESPISSAEVKHRNGRYPTTTNHVWQGMAPKFYEGTWLPRPTRSNKNRLVWYPTRTKDGKMIRKPKYRNRKLIVVIDNLYPPTPKAQRLLTELQISLMTPTEYARYLNRLNKPSKVAKPDDMEHYPFLFNEYGVYNLHDSSTSTNVELHGEGIPDDYPPISKVNSFIDNVYLSCVSSPPHLPNINFDFGECRQCHRTEFVAAGGTFACVSCLTNVDGSSDF